MIQVTEKASAQLLRLRAEESNPKEYVRVAVQGGGCSGLRYTLNFDNVRQDNDHLYEVGTIKLLVDKKSLFYLVGTTLDFSDGLNGKGFQFTNPNAQRTCGCGESFSL